MSRKPEESAFAEKTIRSDLAEPSRPGGRYGMRQTIEPEPSAVPDETPTTDRELRDLAIRTLQADGRLEGQNIEVACSGGIVALTGEVVLEFHRNLATAILEILPGVLVVENRLAASEIGDAEAPGVHGPGDESDAESPA